MSKQKTKTPRTGRPSKGISEFMVRVRAPHALAESVEAEATKVGISAGEAWRRAVRLWLALPAKVRKEAGAVHSAPHAKTA